MPFAKRFILASAVCFALQTQPSVAAVSSDPALAQPAQPLRDFATITPVDPEDLGSVPPNQLATRRIRINNVGDRPFSVSLKSKTCSCVGVEISQTTVKPRESAAISINIQTIASVETQLQSVVFELIPDGGGSPAKLVRVDLRYTPEIEFVYNPTRILRKVRMGDTIDSTIYVRSVDNLSPEVSNVSVMPAWLTARVNAVDPKLPNVCTVTVQGTPPAMGLFSGELTITAGPSKQTNTIPIRVFVGQAVSVVPSTLFVNSPVSSVDRTPAQSFDVTLIGRERDLSNRISIRSNCDCVQVQSTEIQTAPETFWDSAGLFKSRVSISIALTSQPKSVSVRLVELVNDKGEILATIPVVDEPANAVSPAKPTDTPADR